MNKEIEACYTKIKKKIEKLEEKKANLKKYCREKWDEDTYGIRWMSEYDERLPKVESELKKLEWWKTAVYDMYLIAVENGIEEGTHTERVFLGLEKGGE